MLNRRKKNLASPLQHARRVVAGGGVAMALVGAGLLGLLAADSARAELAERIVFRRDFGYLNAIYAMKASDGSSQLKLSTSGDDEYNPAWSPDATEIAFDAEVDFFGFVKAQTFVTPYDSFAQTEPLASFFDRIVGNYSPAWSPNGSTMAYVSPPVILAVVQDYVQIFTMSAIDGEGRTRCSSGTSNAYAPTWSPPDVPMPDGDPEQDKGDLIAFTAFRNGNANIYVMRADCQPFDDGDPETTADLHDGPKDIQLTTSTSPTVDNYGPAWSPDGERIAFTSNRDGSFDVYVMNALDGSNQQRLTDSPAVDYGPTWSPDSQKIAFASDRDRNYQIYSMNAADGSDPRNLSNSATNDYEPSWSPLPVLPAPEPGGFPLQLTALASLLGLRARSARKAGRRSAD